MQIYRLHSNFAGDIFPAVFQLLIGDAMKQNMLNFFLFSTTSKIKVKKTFRHISNKGKKNHCFSVTGFPTHQFSYSFNITQTEFFFSFGLTLVLKQKEQADRSKVFFLVDPNQRLPFFSLFAPFARFFQLKVSFHFYNALPLIFCL